LTELIYVFIAEKSLTMNFKNFIIIVLVLLLGFAGGLIFKLNNQLNLTPTSPKISEDSPQKNDDPKMLDINALSDKNEALTIKLFEDAAPSVTFITTTALRRDFWSRDVFEIPGGTGSGFIWDKKGHIVTNYHVIEGANKALVTLSDNSSYEATVVGTAPEKDLAVLRINAPASSMKPIPVGNSANLKVGQTVLAIGNPFGLDQTLTTGVISALGREIQSRSEMPIRDVIQTDAAINPGNSGGPLLNSSGQLIGVNTAIYSPSGAYAGIGFSIPVDVVNWVVPDIINYGKIKRPRIGIEMVSNQYTEGMGLEGVLIMNVVPGSPAEKAGLRPTQRNKRGDLIIGLGNTKIKENLDLILGLEKYKPGDKVKITIDRNGKKLELNLVLDSM